ncbi:MAG: outer membrane protein assembly factor BamB family protein [Planctomycetota bacterium]
MRRVLLFSAIMAAASCGDDPTRPPNDLAPLELRIITPLPSDTLFDTETIFFAGEATAEDFGLLPDGSLWWTEDGIEIGRGRHIQHLASVGRHTFGFHARYGERSDSVLLAASVMTTMGRVLWTAPLAGSDEGLALSPDGVIYAQDGSAVVAVGPDGELDWRLELSFRLESGPPAVGPDGTVYYGHYDRMEFQPGGVMAIDPTGTIKWTFYAEEHGPPGSTWYHVHGGIAVGPGGSSYFGTDEDYGALYGVNPDGSLKWRTETRPDARYTNIWASTMLLGDTLAVVVAEDGMLSAVNTATGAVSWNDNLGWYSWADYVAAEGPQGNLYIARGGALSAYTPAGSLLWRQTLDPYVDAGCPLIGSDRIYLAYSGKPVRVFDLNGNLVTQFGPRESPGPSTTLAANGVTYVETDSKLYSFDAQGDLRFATAVPYGGGYRVGPVVAPDGTVYVRVNSVGVLAIRDTVGPAPDAAWPTYQGGWTRQGRRVH